MAGKQKKKEAKEKYKGEHSGLNTVIKNRRSRAVAEDKLLEENSIDLPRTREGNSKKQDVLRTIISSLESALLIKDAAKKKKRMDAIKILEKTYQEKKNQTRK